MSLFLSGFSKYHWGLIVDSSYWLITHTLDIPPLTLVSPQKLLPLVFKDDKDIFFAVPTSIFFYYWDTDTGLYLPFVGLGANIVSIFTDSFFEKAEISHGHAARHLAVTIWDRQAQLSQWRYHWCLVTISLFLYALYFSCIRHSLITLHRFAPATVFYYTTVHFYFWEYKNVMLMKPSQMNSNRFCLYKQNYVTVHCYIV